jgi:hypothetical protein
MDLQRSVRSPAEIGFERFDDIPPVNSHDSMEPTRGMYTWHVYVHAGVKQATCGMVVRMDRTLPCGHVFHAQSCLLPWLKHHTTCPLCRKNVFNNGEGGQGGHPVACLPVMSP